MQTYRPPVLPEPEDLDDFPQGIAALEELFGVLTDYRVGDAPRVLDLTPLPAGDREMINQALGEGEVSILLAGRAAIRVQETRLAGVWRTQGTRHDGSPMDTIEVADIPRLVRATAFTGAVAQVDLADEPPEGIINARPVLAELNDQAPGWRPGDTPHVINLTLLPQTDADLGYLDRTLGVGPIDILSRGYGNCRISATALANCWWVRHYNSDERLILNTLEVVDVPAAALAAQVDIEDSAERLAEILEAVR
jgi:hydrogenase-1 operon protein HyaF